MKGAGWIERPVAAVCIGLLLIAVSVSVLGDADIGPREGGGDASYSVTIRHYGVDAREMERSVAIPLEDALSSLRGAVETSSFCEYGKACARVRFNQGEDESETSEAVRDAAERIYHALPSAAQRPEIGYSSDGGRPVWIAAVNPALDGGIVDGHVLERVVKPALEKLAGAGEVEIAGNGLKEMVVELDEKAAAAIGLDASSVASELAGNDMLAAAGSVRISGIRTPIVMDGRYSSAKALGDALVHAKVGKPVKQCSVSVTSERERTPETFARVDGEPAVTIAVYPGGKANLPALSAAIRRETQRLSDENNLVFLTLTDTGAEVARSFSSTLWAAAQGAIAVAVASALLVGTGSGSRGSGADASSRRRARASRIVAVVAVVAVPFALVVSAACLSALGMGLDRHALSGLAVGLGSAVDVALLSSERLGGAADAEDGKRRMMALIPSLASGTATTLVVLVPLAGLDALSEGASNVAVSISAVCIVSFVCAVALMPPLVLGWTGCGNRMTANNSSAKQNFQPRMKGPLHTLLNGERKRLSRIARRLLALNARLCAERPAIPMTVAAILTVAGIVAVLSMPIDPGWSSDEDAVFVHVEFEPGASADSVDARLSAYARELSAVFGVLHVQSTARRGSGIVMASFDRKRTDLSSVVNAIKSIKVSGGFAWVQSGSPHERTFELIVAGEDDSECRRLATIAAQAVSTLPFVRETVLNFKDGPDDLIMTLDRDKAAGMGVGFSRAAGALRRSVHGPVAYKRLEESGEMDVRVTVARAGVSTPADVAGTLIATDNGSIRVDSIMKFSRKSDASRIHRRDRRRIASITMRSEPVDPRKAASAIKNTLSGVDRPAGYAFEFDRAALQKAETIRGTGWSFAVAALLAYMVTATVTESFGAPIAILAALPPSLAVPAVLHAAAGKPFDAAVACAFVAVSGMVVNASVLTVDERRSRGALSRIGASDLYSIIRARSRSLLATCGTTVAGALPFLFLKDTGSAMVRSLSFVAAAGTAASFVFALTVIPALSVAAPSLFATFMLKENKIKGRDT